MQNLFELHISLKSKNYIHSGYHAFKISDPKPRDIHKASVSDRVLHHAIYQKMYFFFDSKFISDSYSCRINKGTHKAIDRFRRFGGSASKNNTRTCWVLKCDIRKFFASIDHEILKRILDKHIKDKDTLPLLSNIIDSFETKLENKLSTNSAIAKNVNNFVNPIFTPTKMQESVKHRVFDKKGFPLGNLTSQLLVNVYMNEFDQFVKWKLKTKYYIRYADDFVVLSEDKQWLEKILQEMEIFLENKLKLEMHPDKVFIKTLASGVDFLGWTHFQHHRVLRTSTKKRMFWNIQTKKGKPETIQSYCGVFSYGNGYKLRTKIISNIE